MKSFIRTGGVGLLIMSLLTGCSAGLSNQAKSRVTTTIGFDELLSDPDQYRGETLVLGGEVIHTRPNEKQSEIMVLHRPLDLETRPLSGKASAGRFLIRSDQFFDPEIYKKGAHLTLVGRVAGAEVRPIGQFAYTYPLLEPIEIKVWPRRAVTYPRFHFGFGLGTSF